MSDMPEKHFRASDVKLPASEEEGVAALRVVKTAINNVQTQLDWAKTNCREAPHGTQIALQRWREREDEILYALMLLRRGESPLSRQIAAVHVQLRAQESEIGRLKVDNDRLQQANKAANARLQAQYQLGKESRDGELVSLREQRDALVESNKREKRLRMEDKDFWQKKFAELRAQLPQR